MAERPAQDHHRTLLEISNALISNLNREDLFHAIAQALRQMLPVERTAIFLRDPGRDVLRLFILESSVPSEYFSVGFEVSATDSHVGHVFQRQEPLLRRDLGRERQYPPEERAYADGIRSYILVPLIARGASIGVLAVASTRPEQYEAADVQFLREVAGQVALAVENVKAYEELAALRDVATRAADEARREAALRSRSERLLRTITEGTAAATGGEFFRSLVRHLAAALGVRHAFVTECGDGERVRTLAFWRGDAFVDDHAYGLDGTPCARVLAGEISHHASGIQARFPRGRDLVDLAAESYLGVPVCEASGRIVGHLAVLDDRPMPEDPQAVSLLRVFAARAGAELERQRAWAEVTSLKNRLQAENVYLQEEIGREHNFVEMVGSHPALLALLRRVEQVAPTDATVLISGETGTGKELIARAIHSRSARKGRPLVKVNCAAISAGLVESELFGHVRGAFTGAIDRRVGRFELADKGTIFLDEVGELPLDTQVKLLRVLQEREFEPVGSSKTVRVDVRVIAATNRDLEEAVKAGRFRADLFYRLDVFPLRTPALRERASDIPQLAAFFVMTFGKKLGRNIEAISQATADRLMRYAWPGNVRELANVIERAAVLCQGPVLELDEDLSPAQGRPGPPGAGLAPTGGGALGTLESMERAHVLAALEQTGWVIDGPRGAARILGLHANTLRSRMEKLGVKRSRHGIS